MTATIGQLAHQNIEPRRQHQVVGAEAYADLLIVASDGGPSKANDPAQVLAEEHREQACDSNPEIDPVALEKPFDLVPTLVIVQRHDRRQRVALRDLDSMHERRFPAHRRKSLITYRGPPAGQPEVDM